MKWGREQYFPRKTAKEQGEGRANQTGEVTNDYFGCISRVIIVIKDYAICEFRQES